MGWQGKDELPDLEQKKLPTTVQEPHMLFLN
jgi:hypothetical protein